MPQLRHHCTPGDYGDDVFHGLTNRNEMPGGGGLDVFWSDECDKDVACADLTTTDDPTGGQDTILLQDGDGRDRWYGGPQTDTVTQDPGDNHVTEFSACKDGIDF